MIILRHAAAPRRAASALMTGIACLLAWRKARSRRRRTPAAAVRASRVEFFFISAALAAAAAALISAKRADLRKAFCSRNCSLLARAKESFDCLALEGSAPCGHTVAAGAGGGTAGPAGPPGSLIAVAEGALPPPAHAINGLAVLRNPSPPSSVAFAASQPLRTASRCNACVGLLQPLILAGEQEQEFRLRVRLGGVRSFRPHCGSRGWGHYGVRQLSWARRLLLFLESAEGPIVTW
jgi:hypothetical protein